MHKRHFRALILWWQIFLRSIKEAQHLVLEAPVVFSLYQHMSPIRKKNISLVVRFELRVERKRSSSFAKKVPVLR